MKEYVAIWHIGEVTRGEIIRLSDEDAEKLLAKGAIVPARVPGGKAPVEPEPEDDEPDVEPDVKPDVEPETGDEIEDGDGNEAEDESEADEDAEAPEIDALEAIGEAEPEPEKPARKPRKSSKKEG